MAAIPRVDDNSRRILRIIQDRGVLSGGELMRASQTQNSEALRAALQPLIEGDLIQSSGNLLDDSEVPYAYFNVRPSALPLVKMLVSQS